MYKHAYNPSNYIVWVSVCMCRRSHVCTSAWVSCCCWLTAELSWSESMRPSDRENRGIRHYHQKRLQCSLLWPHSFLQSSCWFVCSFVVSVRMVRLFESMHFSAPIIWWGRRRAEDKKVMITTERWGHHLLFLFLSFLFFLIQMSGKSHNHIRKICMLCHYVTSWNRGIQTRISPSNSTVVCTWRNWHTWCQCGS